MSFLRYILPVITAFIVYKVSWFTLTDYEGGTLGMTLNGKGDGGEVWVPAAFGELGGFPYGYVIVAALVIGMFVIGKCHDDVDEASFALIGTGAVTLVLTLVSLALKSTVIGGSVDELTVDGYGAMEFSLAPGFWIVLVLSIAMIAVGFVGLGTQSSDDDKNADREPATA
ncbi:MAG: hypothetical protein ACTH1D_06385 [Mycobacteriaceae bacterium]|uniref:hypothetical protein n=1 Tax=Corynebacterium variabile TaxID=1727 RepID=UPI00259418EA|nr:hypothetical protein [uncultured Corynebacterium sp.]